MDSTKILFMGEANRYLGEVMDDLPSNCIFNKGLCGCGGTHLALTNKEPYIVAVPFVEIIRSKLSQEMYTHVYPVCYGNQDWLYGKDKNLQSALHSGLYNKFFVTYASLPKVIKLLGSKVKNYRLLVDEAHMLTDADDKNYMRQQIYAILSSYKKFKSYCFMTSTPYETRYLPEEIVDIPFYKAEWTSVKPVNVITQKVECSFSLAVASIALDHLTEKRSGNAYFFYNSVQGIASVVKKLLRAGCSIDQINIVASKSTVNYKGFNFFEVESSKNEAYLKKYVHPEIKIKGVDECNSDPKKLNFFTSTCFEGCDLYDKKGLIYICSDGRKVHTRIEIHTKIPQIVNRIRDSQYKSTVYLLFTQPLLRDSTTEEEFLQSVEKEIKETESLLDEINNTTERVRKFLDRKRLDTHEFLLYDGSKYSINKNAKKRALSQWNAINHTYYVCDPDNEKSLYKVTPRSDMVKFDHKLEPYNIGDISESKKLKLGYKKISYNKIIQEYRLAITSCSEVKKTFLETLYPRLKELDSLIKNGILPDGRKIPVKSKAILDRHNEIFKNKTFIRQDLNFQQNEWYSVQDVRKRIQISYKKFQIEKSVVAGDIMFFYRVKESRRKKVRGYVVLGASSDSIN
jgi:hypothetical protein